VKNQIIRLDKSAGAVQAEAYFRVMCGYGKNRKGVEERISRGLQTLTDIYEEINLQVLISEYSGKCVDGTELCLDNERLYCRALSQIPSGKVTRLYLFLLTAGEISSRNTSILNQTYYDIWQTAYVDTARDLLRQYLIELDENQGKYVSDSFGPGFYGMEAGQISNFFSLLRAEKIKMELLESGFMSPAKSYAGFFLVTDDVQLLPGKDCECCMSSGRTCVYCKNGRENSYGIGGGL